MHVCMGWCQMTISVGLWPRNTTCHRSYAVKRLRLRLRLMLSKDSDSDSDLCCQKTQTQTQFFQKVGVRRRNSVGLWPSNTNCHRILCCQKAQAQTQTQTQTQNQTQLFQKVSVRGGLWHSNTNSSCETYIRTTVRAYIGKTHKHTNTHILFAQLCVHTFT